MKVALFIIKDRSYIQKQIIKFTKHLKFINLRNEDLLIIEKIGRPSGVIDEHKYIKRNFFGRYLICLRQCFHAEIDKLFFNRIISKRYSDLEIKKFEISRTNSEETKKILKSNGVEISIFICYDEAVDNEILNLSKINLNVHRGMLPDFRGYRTLVWQLASKQPFYVLTLHKMTAQIDGGDIVFELPYKIKPNKPLYCSHLDSAENIHLLLLMGLRRLLMFDLDFGISQANYKGKIQYFKGE